MIEIQTVNTLGLVAKNRRVILPGKQYEQYWQKPTLSDPIIMKEGEVGDTVMLCERIVHATLSDTAQIAKVLQKNTLEDTCRAIFDFLYRHYQYKEDKKGVEQLRRPSRSWADRNEGVDCDCFSITISSILSNLGINHYFRIVKMYGKNYYQHIYVVVPKYQGANMKIRGNYIVIDPVLDWHDYEAPGITFTKDFKQMNGIPIQYLNGVGAGSTNGLGFVLNINTYASGNVQATQEYRKALRAQKQHLVDTRNVIAHNPSLISRYFRPQTIVTMLDQLLGAWDNDAKREETLAYLAGNEHRALINEGLSGIDGFGGFFGAIELSGKGLKQAIKKGAQAVKKVAKKAGKAILKFNPLSVAVRTAFRAAILINFGKLASRAYWGYFSQAEAEQAGIPKEIWEASVKSKNKLESTFVKVLQGNPENLKKDILKGGKRKAADLAGLGNPAAVAAALPILEPLVRGVGAFFSKAPKGEKNSFKNRISRAKGAFNKNNTPEVNPESNTEISESSSMPQASQGSNFSKYLTPTNIGIGLAAIVGIALLTRSSKPSQSVYPASPYGPMPYPGFAGTSKGAPSKTAPKRKAVKLS